MKVVVLAAGAGRSLYPLTRDRPKALLPINGVTILERLLNQTTNRGASAVVVVGYRKNLIIDRLRDLHIPGRGRVQVVENPLYDRTNTLYSLWLGLAHCAPTDDVLVVDGDLVCDDEIVSRILDDPRDAVVAIDRMRVMGDEEVKVVCDASGRVTMIGKEPAAASANGEFLGIARYAAPVVEAFTAAADAILRAGNHAAYYEDALAALLPTHPVETLDVSGLSWVEVDFLSDYVEALRRFGDVEQAEQLASLRLVRRQFLFCPGPVLVSRRVRRAVAAPDIGHREVEFSELLNRVRLKLGKVFGIRNFHRYTTVVVNGSGSAANEALLGTAAIGRRVLVLANGEFGERLIKIATHVDAQVDPLVVRWGQPFDLGAIERAMASHQHDAVAFVHHETSTGMMNPLGEIARLAHRHGLETYVDAVSSLGGVPVDIEAHGLTFCTSSANKALGSIPGVSFVCGAREAFEALAPVKARSLYLDLYRYFSYNDKLYQTPNTPPVNLYFALDAALDDALAVGLERRFAHFARLARRLRRGFRRLGLRPFIPAPHMSPLLTTLELPHGVGAREFHDRLKDLGYIVYAGKGILEDRVFQVANIGALTVRHCDAFLAALGGVLGDIGHVASHHPRRRVGIAA